MNKSAVYTYAGVIPAMLYMIMPSSVFYIKELELVILNYTLMIVVFLAGIHWQLGLQHNSNAILTGSVIIMLAAFISFVGFLFFPLSCLFWFITMLSLLTIYLLDSRYHKLALITDDFIAIRKKITLIYSVVLLIIAIRQVC